MVASVMMQMSILRDGSMVIHPVTTRPRMYFLPPSAQQVQPELKPDAAGNLPGLDQTLQEAGGVLTGFESAFGTGTAVASAGAAGAAGPITSPPGPGMEGGPEAVVPTPVLATVEEGEAVQEAATPQVPTSTAVAVSVAAAPPAPATAAQLSPQQAIVTPAPATQPARSPPGPSPIAPSPLQPASVVEREPSTVGRIQSTYGSFQSFAGMTNVRWAAANGFTRLMTVAAICNRATFAADTQETDTTASAGVAAAPSAATVSHKASKQQLERDSVIARAESSATVIARAATMGELTSHAPPAEPPSGRTDTRTVLGDASEAALLRYVDALMPVGLFRLAFPALHEIPFNSVNKWAITVTHAPEQKSQHLVLMKGAPERIIERCSHHFRKGNEVPIDEAFRKRFQMAYERFGFLGERVLGERYKHATHWRYRSPRASAHGVGPSAMRLPCRLCVQAVRRPL